MKIIIEIEQDFGHTNNDRPTKESLIKEVLDKFPKMTQSSVKDYRLQRLEHWQISSVKVEGR